MKATKYFLLLILTIYSTHASRALLETFTGFQSEPPLSEYIIGRWHGEFMTTGAEGTYVSEYWLEFVNYETLVFSTRSPQLEEYNLLFHYDFIGKDQIRLRARDIDEWKIARDDERLVIISAHGLVPNGEYNRVALVPWEVIALALGLLGSSMLVILLRTSKHYLAIEDFRDSHRESEVQGGKRGFPAHIISEVITVVFFGGGLGISLIFWGGWDLLLIRLPWDAVIMLEVGLILLEGGKIILVKNRTISEARIWALQKIWQHVGVVLIGFSIPGIGIAVFKIILLLIFGSYGFGA